MARRSPYPATWSGYVAESIRQPPDHSLAAEDDLSFPVPRFQRYEEFTPGPFQKGFTPTAYEQTGWEERAEDEFDNLLEHWADDSNLVETLQWFDQPPLYRSPAFPREWEDSDSFGMNLRPIAFGDFKDSRAQQYVHERACAPMIRRRISCMAQAMTNPYKSCIRWLDAEARCFQSIFCKKELVEFESCTEGGDPALGPLCTEYQSALNNCMTKIELFWSSQRNSYWYPDDDLDLDPMPGGIQARDFDQRNLMEFENNGEPLGFVDPGEAVIEAYAEDEDWYDTLEWDDSDEDWDSEEYSSEENATDAHLDMAYLDDEDHELDLDTVEGDDIEEQSSGDYDEDIDPNHLPNGSMRRRDFHSQWPAKRNFERRLDDTETFDPNSPGSQYFPIPVREPDGSWEEEQYEIKQARKEIALAAWRNHGQENFGHVYVRRENR